MAFDGTEGDAIPITDGSALTAEFRQHNPNHRLAHFFGRDILQQILDQPDCMGIRVYYGVNEEGQSELVLAGADADENDMLDLVVDLSMPCPKACSDSNPLNS